MSPHCLKIPKGNGHSQTPTEGSLSRPGPGWQRREAPGLEPWMSAEAEEGISPTLASTSRPLRPAMPSHSPLQGHLAPGKAKFLQPNQVAPTSNRHSPEAPRHTEANGSLPSPHYMPGGARPWPSPLPRGTEHPLGKQTVASSGD